MSSLDPGFSPAEIWDACRRQNPDIPADAPYQSWHFGDSRELAAELAALVLRGKKTATASLVYEYEAEGEPFPQAGGYNLITDFDGNGLGVIQTIEVRILPFDEVDPEFAADEGEGDLSLQFWRDAHWRFFSRACANLGRQPDTQMPVVCERFRLVFPQHIE